MKTDFIEYLNPANGIVFDNSTQATINGTPVHGYFSVVADVTGLDLIIQLLIVIIILLGFIFYEQLVIVRKVSK